jgi:hypothetical protein
MKKAVKLLRTTGIAALLLFLLTRNLFVNLNSLQRIFLICSIGSFAIIISLYLVKYFRNNYLNEVQGKRI